MTNREVAYLLDKIADLLQLKEDDTFKVLAYRKAARSVYHLDEDIRTLYINRRLCDIPGVGKGVAKKIIEMMEEGS
ncbi:MAG TPA: helix-hairpin-helix domain-containing protein, partial [Syntrophomonadaceae bacterium]|nr:helix-hairpin-helix domain-containing protein [Syntrophomonadaceae bacterium]